MGRHKQVSGYAYPEIQAVYINPAIPFGPQLSHLRTDNEIPLREVSEKLDSMDLANLYNWEKGRKHFIGSLDMAITYCKVFNVQKMVILLKEDNLIATSSDNT